MKLLCINDVFDEYLHRNICTKGKYYDAESINDGVNVHTDTIEHCYTSAVFVMEHFVCQDAMPQDTTKFLCGGVATHEILGTVEITAVEEFRLPSGEIYYTWGECEVVLVNPPKDPFGKSYDRKWHVPCTELHNTGFQMYRRHCDGAKNDDNNCRMQRKKSTRYPDDDVH